MALTMRSLTSPVIAPLYWPTQARSDCSASRSACAIALAVSSGFCSAGRTGTVVTGFGLAPAVEGGVICACADGPESAKTEAATINVAESTDLMTNPGEYMEWKGGTIIDVAPIKHICLVGNNRAPVQGILVSPHPEEPRSGVSKDEATDRASWFETRVPRSSP